MKKKLLFGLFVVLLCFVLVGCGKSENGGSSGGGLLNPNKTMTCTKEEVDEDGYKTTETVDVTYNSKKVLMPRIYKELLKINQKKGKYLK